MHRWHLLLPRKNAFKTSFLRGFNCLSFPYFPCIPAPRGLTRGVGISSRASSHSFPFGADWVFLPVHVHARVRHALSPSTTTRQHDIYRYSPNQLERPTLTHAHTGRPRVSRRNKFVAADGWREGISIHPLRVILNGQRETAVLGATSLQRSTSLG